MDIVAQQFYLDVMNPPDSDESENEELTYAEFVEAITESTCINDVDDWGEPAICMLTSNPGFTILRRGAKLGTALVLFPDRRFRVFFTCDIDDALNRMWESSGGIENIDSMDGPSDTQARPNDAEPLHVRKLSTVSESRDRLTAFNASERFNRRLYAADMKAIWDYDHQTLQSNIPGNDLMRDEMEYANYLDFITEKLRIYDDDYVSRLILFKADITSKAGERNLTAEVRARNDKDSLLRQARTESLRKGLRRLMNHRLCSKFEVPHREFEPEDDLDPREESMLQNLVDATYKYEAAIALQPDAAFSIHHPRTMISHDRQVD
jgi:hypothetical protein